MFEDLKVIELAGVLAGPAVGMFFAEMGASVVKIENPKTGGDTTRSWKLPDENSSAETSAYFAAVNWGKQHLFLDLTTENDLQQFYELIKTADIVICNWKMGDAEKLKVDHETLQQINPALIYAQLEGFEDRDRVAYDVVLQAETGWMDMNGTEQSGPMKLPVAIIDLFASHQLKEGILTAWIKKLKTGKGSKVTVSLFDAAIASLVNQASNFLMTGSLPEKTGSRHPNIAPYGEVLRFDDGKEIVLAVGTDKQFESLCSVLNCIELLQDEKYASNKYRVINRKELFEIIKHRSEHLNSEAFLKACHLQHVPVGLIRNLKELFESGEAEKLILEDAIGKRVKTSVFKIE